MRGIDLIMKERKHQINDLNYTVQHDVLVNNQAQLSDAAIKLIIGNTSAAAPTGWNPDVWKKMLFKDYKNRLIIAGALLAAEYDRIELLENESSETAQTA